VIKMKCKLSIIFLSVLLVIAWNCSHKKSPVEPKDDNPPPKNFVTSPQRDLPWPSLAKSPWPMYLHDPQHTGRSPYRGPQEGRVKWMFDTGHDVFSSPALGDDGTIYIGSNSLFLFAITSAGSEMWRFKAEGITLQSDPLIATDGTIYFSVTGFQSNTGSLYALNRHGDLKWKFENGIQVPGEYVISADGKVLYLMMYKFYPTQNQRWVGSLYGLNTSDGTLLWEFTPTSGDGLRWHPAIGFDGTIYCAGNGGLFALKPDGAIKWEFNTGGASRGSASPSVDNAGNIYQSSVDYLHSITPEGNTRWRARIASWETEYSSPAIAYDGTIYVIGLCEVNRNLDCLLALDYAGQLKWNLPLSQFGLGITQNSPVVDVDGTVYLGLPGARTASDSVNFVAVNADGTLKYKMSLRSPDGSTPDIDSKPCISDDGTLYVGSDKPRGKHLCAIK
jgi:outer membrane protein assembly factor BamB